MNMMWSVTRRGVTWRGVVLYHITSQHTFWNAIINKASSCIVCNCPFLLIIPCRLLRNTVQWVLFINGVFVENAKAPRLTRSLSNNQNNVFETCDPNIYFSIRSLRLGWPFQHQAQKSNPEGSASRCGSACRRCTSGQAAPGLSSSRLDAHARTSVLVESSQSSSVETQGRFARDVPPFLYRRLVTAFYGFPIVAQQ